jgi:ribonuclease VapC
LAPKARLSLGDRACLSLAGGLGAVAVTTDRRWTVLDLGVSVRAVR